MVEWMKKIAVLPVELSVEERNLLSVAFKNVIGTRRASWRIISSIEQKEEAKATDDRLEIIQPYRAKVYSGNWMWIVYASYVIFGQFILISCKIYHLLRLRKSSKKSVRIFWRFWTSILLSTLVLESPKFSSIRCKEYQYSSVNCSIKLTWLSQIIECRKGDYFRYLAEFALEEERKEAAENSLVAYKCASEIASTELPPPHPIRLGLALNFSVFYYEILNSSERACRLAKAAFDDAIAELDTLSEESCKDSTLIMQLLRDNLTLWTSDLMEGMCSLYSAIKEKCQLCTRISQ